MNSIKTYLKNWDSARYLKLTLAVILAVVYIFEGDAFYMFFSIFLLLQVIFNFGCGCANGACTTSVSKNDKKVSYEIKEINNSNN